MFIRSSATVGILICVFGIKSESSVIDNQELYDNNPEQRNIRSSEDNCVYTFNVPKTDANACPPGSSEISRESFLDLKESILSKFAEMGAQIENLTNLVEKTKHGEENVQKQGSSKIGTHYTRWGSSTCPVHAELIYNGFAAKSHASHNGGGVNFLCLPRNPVFDENGVDGFQSQSYVFGVEYEKHGSPLVPNEKHDNDAPCAVCHVTGRGEQLMIPAQKTCPTGWTLEYEGILMSQHHSLYGSEFVCVDRRMEVLSGGSADADGGRLYVVEAQCGSLKCPPYGNGKEILCVVCTM